MVQVQKKSGDKVQKAPKAKAPQRDRTFPSNLLVDNEGNSLLNGEGKLTGLPASLYADAAPVSVEHNGKTLTGHATRLFKGLKADQFAESHLRLEYQAELMQVRLNAQQERINELRKRIEEEKTGGSPEQRKKLAKLRRMRAEAEALEKALEAEGITV